MNESLTHISHILTHMLHNYAFKGKRGANGENSSKKKAASSCRIERGSLHKCLSTKRS